MQNITLEEIAVKPTKGLYNDRYILDKIGNDDKIVIHVTGETRPVRDFHINVKEASGDTLGFYQFEYVLGGCGYIEIEGEKYTIGAGDFYFINKSYFRTIRSDVQDPLNKLFITAKGSFIDALISCYDISTPIVIAKLDAEKYFREILKILADAESYTVYVRNAIGIEIAKIIQMIHTECSATNKQQLFRCNAEDIMRYIDSNLSNKFTVNDIADNFFICVTHMTNIFKKKYNITPMKYAQLKRIELAKHYLLNTEVPISALHDIIGLSDAKYFSKLFRQQTGMTPREFRDSQKETIIKGLPEIAPAPRANDD